MRTFQPSLVIEDPNEHPIAVVEAKSLSDMQLDNAVEIRRSMLERGLPAHVPYFLLVSQDVGFLWKDDSSLNADSLPSYEFPMYNVIARYTLRQPDERLYKEELELLVLHWLTNLSSKPQEMGEEPEKTLARAGFTDAIKDMMVLIGEKL
jgi:hypothetical protein